MIFRRTARTGALSSRCKQRSDASPPPARRAVTCMRRRADVRSEASQPAACVGDTCWVSMRCALSQTCKGRLDRKPRVAWQGGGGALEDWRIGLLQDWKQGRKGWRGLAAGYRQSANCIGKQLDELQHRHVKRVEQGRERGGEEDGMMMMMMTRGYNSRAPRGARSRHWAPSRGTQTIRILLKSFVFVIDICVCACCMTHHESSVLLLPCPSVDPSNPYCYSCIV